MIFEKILDAFYLPIVWLLNLITLPALPQELKDNIDIFFDKIFEFSNLLYIFVRPQTVFTLLTYVLVLHGVYYAYMAIMWVVRKIPLLGME